MNSDSNFKRTFQPATYLVARRIFIAWLGLTYLMAFASLGTQITGLLGSDGILPVSSYLAQIKSILGEKSYYLFPSLFWIYSSNAALLGICWGGALLSLGLIFGIAPFLSSVLLWVFYLSIVNVGQDFLSFQWDVLLLEAGFLAIFVSRSSSFVLVLLMRWLLFRLMFLSGLVKLASGDPVWHNLTALQYHYETQPLPTWIGWYAHQLPAAFHQFSALVMFFVELFIPFLFFFNRPPRLFAAAATAGFQILIVLTGNYCFFNFLTVGLCLWLIDDECWPSILRPKVSSPAKKGSIFGTSVSCVLASFIFSMSLIQIPAVNGFHLVNRYGLFAVMTIKRSEIIVEGSYDGVRWEPYEFRYKPGDPKKMPAFVAPHQPRLDWQMWFAALGHVRQNPWFLKLCEKLLQGSPEVSALLKHNPFADNPPRYIRGVLYDYHFSGLAQKDRKRIWWTRDEKGLYCPAVSLAL